MIPTISPSEDFDRLLKVKQDLEAQIENLKIEAKNASLANNAKDQFLANMSHEIRTPLSAILGYAGLISNPQINPKEREEYSRAIARNSDQLLSLIDEILDFSKISAGKVCIERVNFSPLEIINSLVNFFSVQIHAKSIKIMLSSSVTPSTYVISDSFKFQQIITNLLSNAVKFTEKGTIEINFKVYMQNEKNILIFEIKDTGIGIREEQQSCLFTPFVQADANLNRKYGGTGLGLALSRRLAEALGGHLELTASQLGGGSHFTLTIPVELAPTTEIQVPHCDSEKIEINNETLRGLNILIVDDSPDNRFLFKKLLEQVGAKVALAADGLEAVDICHHQSFDIILMDIQMPNLDGYEATRCIRRDGFKKPILALTAHALDQELKRVENAGCNGRILKPAKIEDLIHGIISALKC